MSAEVGPGPILRAQRGVILERWQRRVAEMTEAMRISRIELLDHMPTFLDAVTALMESGAADPAANEAPAQQSAPAHGAQRLNVGFDVDEVIREYGILMDVLLEIASTAGAVLDTRDQRRLFAAVNAGAAEAVREYVRQRDAELHKEQANHRAFMAHELRTPLSTALNASQLVAVFHPALEAARPMQLLQRSLRQVRDLVDQMLTAGRLDAGMEPERGTVDLVAMAHDLEEELAPTAEARRVQLDFVLPSTLEASVDARLIRSAMTNLLRNAVKYTHPDTTVRVSLAEQEGVVVFEVRDGCGGITASNWADLFEPYMRGDDAATRQRDGLGLGLAIAKQAAEAHGGTLGVCNLEGEGCVFELRIPHTPVRR